MAGVVGGAMQTTMHTGTAISLSIQAGLLTVRPGGIEDINNVRISWYFEAGWCVVWTVGFLVWYRPVKAVTSDAEKTGIHA